LLLYKTSARYLNYSCQKYSCHNYFVFSQCNIHGKNGLAEVSENLARYRSENNFVGLSK